MLSRSVSWATHAPPRRAISGATIMTGIVAMPRLAAAMAVCRPSIPQSL